jgi:tetratricopeptide (TPR) repeat protein
MTQSAPKSLSLRLPAALLRFWIDDSEDNTGLAGAEVYRLSRGQPGFHLVAPGTLAITPESGDAAIFDTALHLAQRLVDLAATADERIRLLVLPGELDLGEGAPRASSDPLVEKAPTVFSALEPGIVYVTGWVLRMLELPRQSEEVVIDRNRSDPQPPLFRTGSRRPEITPWRNSEILNRRIRTIPRSALTQSARELLSSPAWRLEGPLGCGKTYFAHQLLLKAKIPRLWLRGEPKHRRTGSFAQQIVEQISATTAHDPHSPLLPRHTGSGFVSWPPAVGRDGGIEELSGLLAGLAAGIDGTFYLVVDDLEQCSPGDLQILSQMASLQEVGRAFRLLLIGRTGISLPDALKSLPTLGVEPFTDQEMNQFSPQLFAGLSLPTSMQDRLHVATHGCPFALEEAMIALIREQTLRRVYGGFFFAGQETTDFSPSPRLLAHLQAEAYRVGVETPVHLLSLVESGVPGEILSDIATKIGHPAPKNWDRHAKSTRLLVESDTPWGPGVNFTCPVFGAVFAFGLEPDSVQDLRSAIGKTLANASSGGKALWEAYRLLRGTSAGTEPLLEALNDPYAARIPRAALLEILTQELFRHREREGDSETELQLLWKLLPLARKLGQLNEYTSDLERGVELAADQPRRLLALAGLKAEMDQDAGRYKEAEATIQTALEAAKGADDRRQALLLIQLGRLYLDQERYTDAQRLFKKLAERLDQSGVEALAASCRYYLGNIALHEENYDEALELHKEALERRQRQKLNRVAGSSLTATGAVYLALGNYPQALRCYREALDLLERHGGDIDRAYPLLGLGRTLNHLGDYTAAARSLREALNLREGKDDIAGEAIARLAVAENNLFLGQLEKAQEEATKALFHLNLLSRKALLADAEQLLGMIQIRLRQSKSARRHLETALAMHREKGNQRSVAFDVAHLLQLALIEENPAEVSQLTTDLEEAVRLLARPDLEEQLHFQIFQSWQWQSQQGDDTADPQPHLKRAYRELFRKASHLDPELRHQFLFQISEYRKILEEGSRAGLTTEFND